MKVQGQSAIVTGGASGLGEATARALAQAGAKVAILDFNLAAAQVVARDIGGLALHCDVASAESAEAAVGAARDAFGPARILVNCAGIAPGGRVVGRAGPMPLDDFRRGIEVNLIGSFNLVRLVAAGASTLEPDGGGERGVIVNTASVAAYDGQIGQVAYAASKAGVVGMTLPAARDLAPSQIRVVTIAPGIFDTPMLGALPEDKRAALATDVVFPKRLGDPAEYGALVAAIVDNGYLNGETIRLDGALRMPPK
jgi:NAD(P)-dependent dehydrogenase (short-subunit alcohol dehydrogenase family)